jgi:hypothetical protein
MPHLEAHRHADLSEAQILGQIGALLAAAIIRHDGLRKCRPAPLVQTQPAPLSSLLADGVEQEVVRYLARTGEATSGQIQTELGVSRGVLAGRLRHLRVSGLCIMTGKTRAARYRLRTEFSAN